ncbi:hypothetical protein M9H77_24050 [Catharanthus roseus]|uniref:Uncharacterized protein n=1 Tax=Catharanthus roseus TaxID=4058 RepID=A0ACC0AXK3_CATRO|nr:hypothetical protein M9H77_24050 [Catharanthus roseus]
MRVPSYYEVHRMFYFNLYSMNNDDEIRYLWTIPPHLAKEGIHILVEFEHIQQQNIPNTHDRNTTTLPEHITAVTQMVSDEPSMLYITINNDDDEVDGSDGDDVVSSQSESDDDNDPEEGEFQTPLNPVNHVNPITENIVQHGRAANGSAALDMGSGSPTDDLVESGTIQLLDWNDSMTGIQLCMRFVDKVQAISAVRIVSNRLYLQAGMWWCLVLVGIGWGVLLNDIDLAPPIMWRRCYLLAGVLAAARGGSPAWKNNCWCMLGWLEVERCYLLTGVLATAGSVAY